MGFPEAEARLFEGIWICMKCNAKHRSPSGKPVKCRKCGAARMRVKRKKSKKG